MIGRTNVGGGGGSSDWELIGSATYMNKVNFEKNIYKEFIVIQTYNIYQVRHFICRTELSTGKLTYAGSYISSSDNRCGSISFDETHFQNAMSFYNGSSVLSSTTLTVYGRR